ncbi:PR domain zinc finger protein 2 isoform X2 [Pseudophryne corroboree]|uniref:PR domain zinc finger protein 2 isoform X2 n=1 Tax=Pseudophryne corroboree TaxID=495146 RepID=UPI0030818885
MNQDAIKSSEATETLADVPEHVLRGLPEEVTLSPSAVDNLRLGIWTRKPLPKGKKFGPFVGEKKKRSQVKNNVYMWEVYYPNLGWMCVDATDPQKANWLRYVNWARSAKEQNLCPLEINRAIYYKTLKPIEPEEELLVWYNGEDNPDIAAAIEEERAASHRGRRRALHGKNKLSLNRQGKKTGPEIASAEMKDSPDAPNEEDIKPLGSPVLSLEQTAVIQEMVNHNVLPECISIPTTKLLKISDQKSMEEVALEQELAEDLYKESSERDSLNQEEDSAEMLDDFRSTSDETPEGSPKKKPVKIGKPKGDANGESPEAFMFPCQHCERKFTTKQGLERHMHIHVSTINHAFKCRYCGKAFGTQINRRRHERRHEAGPKRKSLELSASGEFVQTHKHIIDSLKATDEYSSSRLQYKMTDSDRETSHSVLSDENGEPSRELHPCKYCKKVFGTHTNMRRHQRRVHERHLIPKGVRRKGHLLEDTKLKSEQSPPDENVYIENTEIEEDGEVDDVYIMDISNNISENLTYYIDGKIPSNIANTACDVIEVETSSTDVLGINCLLTPIKVEVSQNTRPLPSASSDNPNPLSDSSCSGILEPKKRRTISPPLLSKIKTEVELEPVTPSCSLTIPLSVAVGDNLPFQKEKNVYLSSKLKQLLQMQESNKSQVSPSLLSEIPKLSPAVSTMTTCSNRFKRRTTSPPSSPQHSPAAKEFVKQEGKTSWNEGLGPKIPKLESHSHSPVWSLSGREDQDSTSPCEDIKIAKDWTSNLSFGNVCNQQPLDLSSGVKQKSDSKSLTQVPWESVLDLSVNKKPFCESDTKEYKGNILCIGVKKKKPTTCMLKKVLLNEYDELEVPEESISQTDASVLPCRTDEQTHVPELEASSSDDLSLPPEVSSPAPVEHICTPVCQSPPILTPSEATSPTPCPPFLMDSSSPPPLLTTNAPSLPDSLCSVPPTPSCPSPLSAITQSPLPVLSCTVSPSPSPSPTTDPSGSASPGPPTLSSSSSSSSSSSTPSSSSSSSCSSPPPLTVGMSVLSPSLNLESSAVMFVKQERHEEVSATRDSLQTSQNDSTSEGFNKTFVCNVCELPFTSIKDLAKHLVVHAEEWPFKCEFCVQLFKDSSYLSEHRSMLHGVGKIFVCSICKKEFAFLCNLQQHQQDLHADQEYSHHELENGTLRPQNFTDPSKASLIQHQRIDDGGDDDDDPMTPSPEDDEDLNDSSEELYTTIKIMASGEKSKNPDVRMGLNQHYPSFKPPPFQYHTKNPMGIGTTATNFTTHNIPQTFTTAIRCTKCGKGVDNMPELHKHILVCASASDKKRYTPKKNPIPLKQTVQPKNGVGVVLLEATENSPYRRIGQPKKLNFTIEIGKMSSRKLKLGAIKRKNQLLHKAILQKNKKAKQKSGLKINMSPDLSSHVCPYCNREFTYLKSLNKHASFSCPKKPASPPTKKTPPKPLKKSSSAKKHAASITRRTADAEIQMQSTETHLGKTRARSITPAPIQLPTIPIKSKQSVKSTPPVKSKKPNVPVIRNSSPVRMSKSQTAVEGKKLKKATLHVLPQSFGKTSRKLHVKLQKNKLPNKQLAKKKKKGKYKGKSRERVGGPRTRSSADYSDKREDGRPESRNQF